jgi:hypothetical protein
MGTVQSIKKPDGIVDLLDKRRSPRGFQNEVKVTVTLAITPLLFGDVR